MNHKKILFSFLSTLALCLSACGSSQSTNAIAPETDSPEINNTAESEVDFSAFTYEIEGYSLLLDDTPVDDENYDITMHKNHIRFSGYLTNAEKIDSETYSGIVKNNYYFTAAPVQVTVTGQVLTDEIEVLPTLALDFDYIREKIYADAPTIQYALPGDTLPIQYSSIDISKNTIQDIEFSSIEDNKGKPTDPFLESSAFKWRGDIYFITTDGLIISCFADIYYAPYFNSQYDADYTGEPDWIYDLDSASVAEYYHGEEISQVVE